MPPLNMLPPPLGLRVSEREIVIILKCHNTKEISLKVKREDHRTILYKVQDDPTSVGPGAPLSGVLAFSGVHIIPKSNPWYQTYAGI